MAEPLARFEGLEGFVSMPNAASESLEKYLFTFSFISGSEHLLLGTSAMAEPLARFEGFEGFEGFKGFEGFEGFEGLHSPSESLEKNCFFISCANSAPSKSPY